MVGNELFVCESVSWFLFLLLILLISFMTTQNRFQSIYKWIAVFFSFFSSIPKENVSNVHGINSLQRMKCEQFYFFALVDNNCQHTHTENHLFSLSCLLRSPLRTHNRSMQLKLYLYSPGSVAHSHASAPIPNQWHFRFVLVAIGIKCSLLVLLSFYFLVCVASSELWARILIITTIIISQ